MMKTDGRIYSRETVYKGIKMRSRLEAAWAEQFDALGWQWEYEPICLAGEQGQYLPDFAVRVGPRSPISYFEVKGGWWESPKARGLSDDDDDQAAFSAVLDLIHAEREKMVSLVAAHDPHAVFVMLTCPNYIGDASVVEVHLPGKGWRHECGIVRCEEGCAGIVKMISSVCVTHNAPWTPVELVDSLHMTQFTNLQSVARDVIEMTMQFGMFIEPI